MATKKCTSCNNELNVDQFGTYKSKNGTVKVRSECKACRVQRESERNKANPERHNEYSKAWKSKNKDAIRVYENARVKEKRKVDVQFQIRTDLTSHLRHFVSKRRVEIRGLECDHEQFKDWFEYQFQEGMSWNDPKTWEIDHVIPLSCFDLTNNSQYCIACHWTNTRPTTALENKKKNNSIRLDYIINHIHTINAFLANHNRYQVCMATCIWQTVEVWYGKNAQDEESFENFLKWAIRSQATS